MEQNSQVVTGVGPTSMVIRETVREVKVSEYVQYKGHAYRRVSISGHVAPGVGPTLIRWEYDSYFMYMSMELGQELEGAYADTIAAAAV